MTTTLERTPESDEVDDRQHRLRWLVLGVLGLAQLMVVLDATIVNIALPDAQKDLGFLDDQRQWVITAYALAFGSLLLLGGRLSDLFGQRITFIVGLIGFAGMSAVGGAAVNFEMLVAARAGQGIFGALLAPAALSLLATTFTSTEERAKAFGIFGAIAGGGGALGLLLGGLLTEYLNWRWALYVNLVIAAIALVGAIVLLAPRASTHRPRLDIRGTLVVSAGLFAVVYGFSNAETNGWADWATITWLVVGAILLAVFVVLQSRTEHALLPLRVITDRTRAGSYLAVFIVGIGMFGVFLFLTYYMQLNLQYSPVKTGLAFMPMILPLIVAATSSTALVLPRFGPRWLMTGGLLTAAGGMVWLTQLGVTASYTTDIMPGLIVMGLGLGCAMAPAMQGAISGVAADDAGVASATVNTMQQVGGSIGTAMLSTIFASAVSGYASSHPQGPALMAESTVHGYTVAFWVSAGIFALGALTSATIIRSGKLAATPEGAVMA